LDQPQLAGPSMVVTWSFGTCCYKAKTGLLTEIFRFSDCLENSFVSLVNLPDAQDVKAVN
jgi:hypothetical protein